MDRERIAHIFFFGFLAVMGYELYLLLSPFLVPIVWAMLLAFITHPALLQLERVVRSRTAAALVVTLILALIIAIPTAWLSARSRWRPPESSLGQFVHQAAARRPAPGRSTPTRLPRSKTGSSSRACESKTCATG